MPQAQWQVLAAPPFSYLETLDKVDEAIESNAELARAIVRTGLQSFHVDGAGASERGGQPPQELRMPEEWVGVARHADIDKARSTLRQFFRDWSVEGAAERDASYGPVLKALEAERERRNAGASDGAEPPPFKVLVPGAGLGRLVFELCKRGFAAEGNEISYHQLLASSYILNSCERAGKHTVYPWVHTFSNHRSRENHLRGYSIPDIHPGTELAELDVGRRGEMSMYAADFLCLYADEEHADAYDAVACVFFLDTAPNLMRYLEVIFHSLRPGGVLVNLGPLLWHFENNAPGNHGRDDDGDGEHDANGSSGIADPGSFELTDDEVMALLEKMGFEVVQRVTGLEAPYIQDVKSMLQTVYRASSWVARKPAKGGVALGEIEAKDGGA